MAKRIYQRQKDFYLMIKKRRRAIVCCGINMSRRGFILLKVQTFKRRKQQTPKFKLSKLFICCLLFIESFFIIASLFLFFIVFFFLSFYLTCKIPHFLYLQSFVDGLFSRCHNWAFHFFFRPPTRSAVQKVIYVWITRISLVIKQISALEFGRFSSPEKSVVCPTDL